MSERKQHVQRFLADLQALQCQNLATDDQDNIRFKEAEAKRDQVYFESAEIRENVRHIKLQIRIHLHCSIFNNITVQGLNRLLKELEVELTDADEKVEQANKVMRDIQASINAKKLDRWQKVVRAHIDTPPVDMRRNMSEAWFQQLLQMPEGIVLNCLDDVIAFVASMEKAME